MNYTAEVPTEPGYYWLKNGETEEIVEIWTDPEETEPHLWIHRCGDGCCAEIASVNEGQWAGPIPRPV